MRLARRLKHSEHNYYHGTLWDKRLYRSIWIVSSIIFLGYVIQPGRGGATLRIAAAIISVSLLLTCWRGWHLGAIQSDTTGVTAHGAIRRWHWAWDEVDRFSAESGTIPFSLNRH